MPDGFAACAVNFTVVGSQTPALKNSVREAYAVTNPFILTAGVGVFGVNKASGVAVETVGVKSSVGVQVLRPASVGVVVKVEVAIVAVNVGIFVGGMVLVAAEVGLLVGIKKTWSNVIEQEESRTAVTRKMHILFI